MKVMVTGGAGEWGKEVIAQLLAEGNGVLVYDNLCSGSRKDLPFEVKFVMGDVRDGSLLARAMKDFAPEILIHGALVPSDMGSWSDGIDQNLGGLIQSLKCFAQSTCQKMVIRKHSEPDLSVLQKALVDYVKTKTTKQIVILDRGLSVISSVIADQHLSL